MYTLKKIYEKKKFQMFRIWPDIDFFKTADIF